MPPRAITETKRCPMSEDACAARVIEHIGAFYCRDGNGNPPDVAAIVEQACGRFTRGKHLGKLRGWASVEICTHGGWKRTDNGHGGMVLTPGTIVSVNIADFNGKSYLSVSLL